MTLVLLAHPDFQEMMEKGVTMEKLGLGGCPGSLDHVVFLGQKGLLALQDLQV